MNLTEIQMDKKFQEYIKEAHFIGLQAGKKETSGLIDDLLKKMREDKDLIREEVNDVKKVLESINKGVHDLQLTFAHHEEKALDITKRVGALETKSDALWEAKWKVEGAWWAIVVIFVGLVGVILNGLSIRNELKKNNAITYETYNR